MTKKIVKSGMRKVFRKIGLLSFILTCVLSASSIKPSLAYSGDYCVAMQFGHPVTIQTKGYTTYPATWKVGHNYPEISGIPYVYTYKWFFQTPAPTGITSPEVHNNISDKTDTVNFSVPLGQNNYALKVFISAKYASSPNTVLGEFQIECQKYFYDPPTLSSLFVSPIFDGTVPLNVQYNALGFDTKWNLTMEIFNKSTNQSVQKALLDFSYLSDGYRVISLDPSLGQFSFLKTLPSGDYSIKLFATNGDINAGIPEKTFSIKLQSTTGALTAPTNIKTSSVPNGLNYDVTLTWDPVSTADAYILEISNIPNLPPDQAQMKLITYEAKKVVKDVAPGTYYLSIRAASNNLQTYSPITNFTATIPGEMVLPTGSLTAPVNLKASTNPNGTNYDVKLSWDAIPGAQDYVVGVTDKPNPVFSDYLIFPAVIDPTISVPNVPAGSYNVAVAGRDSQNLLGQISKYSLTVPIAGVQQIPQQEEPPQEEIAPQEPTIVEDVIVETPSATLPKQEIISCDGEKNFFYLNTNDSLSLNCFLSANGIVSAGIYKTSFDPKNKDHSASQVRSILRNKTYQKGFLKISWDGLDDFDQIVGAGEYIFVAQASPNSSTLPDISMQKFKVAEKTAEEILAESIFKSATENEQSVELRPSASVQNALAGKPSKCPGVNYSFDLPAAGARFEQEIIKAFDLCLVSGFPDGTFRAESTLTRAQATKIVLLARGSKPKEGCYNLTCGSPFYDLDLWQGKYIRAAWDERIIVGMAPGIFEPNRETTRAEAASLVVKALKIPPHQGCYSAHCGAGYPSNIFYDIVRMWEGPFVRALWDRGAAMATGKNTFSPERAIKRGEFLEMVLRAKNIT